MASTPPPPGFWEQLRSIVLANGPLEAVVAFIIIGGAAVQTARWAQAQKGKPKVEIEKYSDGMGALGFSVTAKRAGLYYPKVAIGGVDFSLLKEKAVSNVDPEYMHVDDPRYFAPWRISYASQKTPMWVKVEVTTPDGSAVYTAQVLVEIRRGKLFAKRINDIPVTVTFDIKAANFRATKMFAFKAVVPPLEGVTDTTVLSPGVVSFEFKEVKRPIWKRLLRL